MPILALASDLGLSIPLSPGELPFSLLDGTMDLIPWVDRSSYSLDDTALTQPGIFTFTLTDPNNEIGHLIGRLDIITWMDNTTNTVLYRGFVRQIDNNPVANYSLWTITCADISEMYDYGFPLIWWPAPAQTTQARIQFILSACGSWPSPASGGYIQALSGDIQPAIEFSKDTCRSAIEKALALEGTGTDLPSYYMDYNWRTHVFFGYGDMPAPYALTDTNPDGISSVSYSGLVVTQDSTQDVDAVMVYAADVASSNVWFGRTRIPRPPWHFTSVNASESTTLAQSEAIALTETNIRQNVVRITAVVTGYDGWAKGQYVYLTSVVNALDAIQFWIVGVSMVVLSGTGIREYTLTLNSSLPRVSRIAASGLSSTGDTATNPASGPQLQYNGSPVAQQQIVNFVDSGTDKAHLTVTNNGPNGSVDIEVAGGGASSSSARISTGAYIYQLAGGGYTFGGDVNQDWDDGPYFAAYGSRVGTNFDPAATVAIVPTAGRWRFTVHLEFNPGGG